MNHRLICVMAILTVIFLVGVGACAALSPTPTSTSTPVTTPTPESITLKVHVWGSPRPWTESWSWFTDEVTKRTGGTVQFQYYYEASLGQPEEQIDNLQRGMFDIGPVFAGFAPGKTPLWSIMALPVLTSDMVVMNKALVDIAEQPAFKAELQNWNIAAVLWGGAGPAGQYLGVKPVHKAEDFEGLRIRTYGEMSGLASGLGAVPVSMAAPEVYEALQRGMVDGAFDPWAAQGPYKRYEVAKYATEVDVGTVGTTWVINTHAWDRLGAERQKIFLELVQLLPEEAAKIYEVGEIKWMNIIKEEVDEFDVFDAEEKAKVRDAGKPVWDKWVENMQGKGLPGQESLRAFLDTIDKHEKQ